MKIYKYELKFTRDGVAYVDMHRGAKVINVDLDMFKKPSVWAEVDTDNPMQKRKFVAVTTGGDVPTSPAVLEYVGSFWLKNDRIFHLYEDWAQVASES